MGLLSCGSKSNSSQGVRESGDSLLVPDLEYIEDFFDFGTIYEGEIVSHTFMFKNAGNGILLIKDVIPSCGCTKSTVSRRLLKPGETGTVEVIFNSTGWYGSQYKSVALRTNSIINEKSVTIKANVVEGNGS